MTTLKVLDLFSGIGGFSLGLERTGGFETVGFCEINPFCQKVLAKHWPDVPIHEDVRSLEHDGPVDVITGGYPCQPFSLAGKRDGAEDDRHLWPSMFALIQKHRPAWVIGENVFGHISLGLDEVLTDLEGEGYACRAFVVPACAVDAPHRRDRVWIVAHTEHRRLSERRGVANVSKEADRPNGDSRNDEPRSSVQKGKTLAHSAQLQRDGSREHSKQGKRQIPKFGNDCSAEFVANANSINAQGQQSSIIDEEEWQGQEQRQVGSRDAIKGRLWSSEPSVRRVAHGIPNRVDRLKALGNTVVPQIPELIGRAILDAEKGELVP